jgi:hypothetical protein
VAPNITMTCGAAPFLCCLDPLDFVASVTNMIVTKAGRIHTLQRRTRWLRTALATSAFRPSAYLWLGHPSPRNLIPARGVRICPAARRQLPVSIVAVHPALRPVRLRSGCRCGVCMSDAAAQQHCGRAGRSDHQFLRHRANPFSPVLQFCGQRRACATFSQQRPRP